MNSPAAWILPHLILAWCLAAPVAVWFRGLLPALLQPLVAVFAIVPIAVFVLIARRADPWLALLTLAALPAGVLLLASIRWSALLDRPLIMITIQVTLILIGGLALLFYLGLRSFES